MTVSYVKQVYALNLFFRLIQFIYPRFVCYELGDGSDTCVVTEYRTTNTNSFRLSVL
jgi:hypothetical protein